MSTPPHHIKFTSIIRNLGIFIMLQLATHKWKISTTVENVESSGIRTKITNDH